MAASDDAGSSAGSSPEFMADLLNPYQRNSAFAVLRAYEHDLRQVQTWLLTQPVSGILYRQVLHLSEEERRQALAYIAEALAYVAEMAQALGLEPMEEDLGAAAAGSLIVDWANLEDLRSDKLRAYGAVDPHLRSMLDPFVRRLADSAFSLASFLKHPGDRS